MAIEIKRNELLDYYHFIWNEADTYFRTKVQPNWDRALNLYKDKFDFGRYLEEDVSHVALPIADNLVTRMSSFFGKTLVSLDGKYFTFEKTEEKDKAFTKGCEAIVTSVLADSKYTKKFVSGLASSLITSPYYARVLFQTDKIMFPTKFNKDTGEFEFENKLIGKTVVSDIDPYHMRLDPNPHGDSYIIEIIETTLPEFIKVAQTNGWDKKAIKEVTDRAMGVSAPKGIKNTEEDSAKTTSNYSPKVTLHYVFTKAATNSEGVTMAENIMFIVADKETILHVDNNPLPNGRFPYVVGFPLGGFRDKYKRGYLEKLTPLLSVYVEAIDLLMMVYRLTTWGVWGYDPEDAADQGAHKISQAIKPGRRIPLKSLKNLYNNSAGAQMGVQIQGLLDFLIQILSYQNEFSQGRPTTKGRPTAFEIREKMNAAQSFFNDIALEIEDEIITPLIELVLMTEFIYQEMSDHPGLETMIKDSAQLSAVKSKTLREKMELLIDSNIKARGMSGRIQRKNIFDKVVTILQVVAQLGDGIIVPGKKKITTDTFLEKMLEGLDENEAEYIQVEETLPTGNTGELPNQNMTPGDSRDLQQQLLQAQGGQINAGK